MKRLLLASALAALPFAANAADLSSDNAQYNFIQDNAPSQPAVVGHLDVGLGYVDLPSGPYWQFEGTGRANVGLGGLNVELETGGVAEIFDDGAAFPSIGVAGHFWGPSTTWHLAFLVPSHFPPA